MIRTYTLASALLASIVCGQRVAQAQSLVPEEIEADVAGLSALGAGFSTLRGMPTGAECVVGNTSAGGPTGGALAETRAQFIRSDSELREALRGSVGFRLGLFGVGVQAHSQLVQQFRSEENTTRFVITVRVRGPWQRLSGFTVRPEWQAVLGRAPVDFFSRCGEGFVSAVRFGGDLTGLVSIRHADASRREAVEADLRLTFGPLSSGSGDLSGLRDVLTRSGRQNISVMVSQRGGPPIGGNVLDFTSFFQQAEAFRANVSRGVEAVPVAIEATSYRALPAIDNVPDTTQLRRRLEDVSTQIRNARAFQDRLQQQRRGQGLMVQEIERRFSDIETAINLVRSQADTCLNAVSAPCNIDQNRISSLLTPLSAPAASSAFGGAWATGARVCHASMLQGCSGLAGAAPPRPTLSLSRIDHT